VGKATANITPDRPVALQGQRHTRIATTVESPCLAPVLAIETRNDDKTIDHAVFVACDATFIPNELRDGVRERLLDRAPGLDAKKVVLSATHTHTSPVLRSGTYDLPSEGIMQPEDCLKFTAEQIADAVVVAWNGRKPATVGWGLGHAVVARNRLAIYADGHAQMYGDVKKPDFVRFEGYEDHGVEVLYFWDLNERLIATAINVACPAQEVEGRSTVNADFWHNVREKLREKHGKDFVVLGWTGPGGDQSPHPQLRKAAEKRMQALRGITSLDEIALRIVAAWEDALDGAKHDKHAGPVLAHHISTISLPKRTVTQEEMLAAKQKAASYGNDPKEKWNRLWNQKVVDRYEQQAAGETAYEMELHVVRLGDIAIATNEFELYTDYGVLMKARSPAVQTFLLQLAGRGTYLPAARSIPGGAYGSIIQSGEVGSEGGQVLVDKTLAAINRLFSDVK
jgi:hypothetical protein